MKLEISICLKKDECDFFYFEDQFDNEVATIKGYKDTDDAGLYFYTLFEVVDSIFNEKSTLKLINDKCSFEMELSEADEKIYKECFGDDLE